MQHSLTSCCVLGPELPAWLAAPPDSCSRSNKPGLKIPTNISTCDNKRTCRRHKQASHLPPSASVKAEAAGQDHDNSGAEHLLDIWVSDSDEPSLSSKHRYMSPAPLHPAFAVHSCKKVAQCRMPTAAVPSSSDSEDDGVTESWKFNPENSKPKQRQVCDNSIVLKPMLAFFTTFLHSTFLNCFWSP